MSSLPTEKTAPAGEQPRLAAIDIGTNSIRCLVMEVDAAGDYRIIDDEKVQVRLGEGLQASGRLSAAAIRRSEEALTRMAQVVSGLGARSVEVVATSAVRKAANGDEFLETVRQRSGLEIRVISGEEEAELALLSARQNFPLADRRFGLVDIGGGSAEVVIAAGAAVESVCSLELGAVYLSEWLGGSDPLHARELENLRTKVRRSLKQAGFGAGPPLRGLIGSGGTVNNIGAMAMALRGEDFTSVHRYEVLHSEVVHLRSMLERMSCAERRRVPGLDPARADIIVAGVTVIDELMRRLGANLLSINQQGIRQGLILRALERSGLRPESSPLRDRRTALLEFGRACRFDEAHGLQVERLGQTLRRALARGHDFPEEAERILEAAALLHDCGYFIAYDRHHKHSYHLIRHANLFGLTPRERELAANVARYHRKALPKAKHANFAALGEADRRLVSQLGGILRLADGLDRRRNGAVQELRCRLDDGELHLVLHGEGELAVEVFGARKKGDLLCRACSLQLEVEQG